MDDVAGVDRDDHALDVDCSAVLDRDLHRRGRVAAVGIDHRDAAVHALGRGRAPPHRFRHRVEHAEVLLLLLQQRAPELVRILAGGVRQLVDEALAEERVVGVRHGAPESRRHMRVAHGVLVGEVRHGVRVVLEAAHVDRIDAVLDVGRPHRDQDRLVGLPHVPRDPVALRVQPGAQLHQRHRTVASLLHVLFARPLQAAPACPACSARSAPPAWCTPGAGRAGRSRRPRASCAR